MSVASGACAIALVPRSPQITPLNYASHLQSLLSVHLHSWDLCHCPSGQITPDHSPGLCKTHQQGLIIDHAQNETPGCLLCVISKRLDGALTVLSTMSAATDPQAAPQPVRSFLPARSPQIYEMKRFTDALAPKPAPCKVTDIGAQISKQLFLLRLDAGGPVEAHAPLPPPVMSL